MNTYHITYQEPNKIFLKCINIQALTMLDALREFPYDTDWVEYISKMDIPKA